MKPATARPLRFTGIEVDNGSQLPLPGILRSTTLRGTTGAGVADVDPLLAGVVVANVYALDTTSRGSEARGDGQLLDTGTPELLAVEAEDGATLFIRTDTLAESIARLQPEAVVDGVVDFARFHDPNARARGVGEVLWKAATVLRLPHDALVDEAMALAREWAQEQLGEKVEAAAYDWGSALAAKALMWKIEARLAGRPGLYHWHQALLAAGDRCQPVAPDTAIDPRLISAAQGQPMLVLIHGTGSYTVASFADLRADAVTWNALQQRFPGGIFGFEHRTFSESPSENALALLDALLAGARVSLLTHSRGGLVGDLLCLG
ncbi:MAG: hypothetical protein ABI478_11820, partial [Propionivibrio sp.]